MNAAVVKKQAEEEPEGEPPLPSELEAHPSVAPWRQFIPAEPPVESDPVRQGVRDQSKVADVIHIFGQPRTKTRADFTSDCEWEIYLIQQQINEGLSLAPMLDAAAGASIKDESEAYYRWLRHAEPHGYTSNIRTRPEGSWTDEDYVVVGKEKFPAPKRMRRERVLVRLPDDTFKRSFMNVDDVYRTEEVEEEQLLTYRGGKQRTVNRIVTKREGFCPLGKPPESLVTFTPLDFSCKETYERDKHKYLKRAEYSKATRKKYGRGVSPQSKVLVRRPPDVMWFLKNPDGMSYIYGDEEPWPDARVDPLAAEVNENQRRVGADILNSMKTDKIVPMRNLRPLRDRLYETEDLVSGPARYEGEISNVMKDVLAAYASHLKEAESGYRPEDVHEAEDLIGHESVSAELAEGLKNVTFRDDVLPWGPAYDDAVLDEEVDFREAANDRHMESPLQPRKKNLELKHLNRGANYPHMRDGQPYPWYVDVIPETGKGNQSESVTFDEDGSIVGEYTVKHQEESEPVQMGQSDRRSKENLRRLIIKAMDRMFGWEPTQLVPVMTQGQGVYPGYEDVHVEGGYHRIRYDSPEHGEYLRHLIERLDADRDKLVEAMIRWRAVNGWPSKTDEFEEFLRHNDVNIDGILDDIDVDLVVERVPRRMKLQDIIPRKRGIPKPAFKAYLRKCKQIDDRARKTRQRKFLRMERRAYQENPMGSSAQLLSKLELQRKRTLVRTEVESLRSLAMNARAYRYQMAAREADRRDAEIMSREMRRDPQMKRIRRKTVAIWVRAQRWWNGESVPTTPLDTSKFEDQIRTEASVPQGEPQNNTEAAVKPARTSGTVRKQSHVSDSDVVSAVKYLPPEEFGEKLIGVRKALISKGIPPEELECTEVQIATYFPSMWAKFSKRRERREKMAEDCIAA